MCYEELANRVLTINRFHDNSFETIILSLTGSSIFPIIFILIVVKQEYYSLPLSLDKVLQKQDHPRCTLQQSVHQYLHLIITTAFGEMSNDAGFGSWIWENDFDNVTSNNKIREQIKQSLLHAVQKYETRIQNVKVDILIRQEEQFIKINGRHVKKMMEITISGFLAATREPVVYHDRFFTGPLSYS